MPSWTRPSDRLRATLPWIAAMAAPFLAPRADAQTAIPNEEDVPGDAREGEHAASSKEDDGDDDTLSLLKVLAPDHADDHDEGWNAYGQFTSIAQWKPPFAAPYTNANGSNNSLLASGEASFTESLTLFLGRRLWPGAEAYLVPEVVAQRPLSELKGLGASVQNFELQKSGGPIPSLYRSRTFIRQTIGLGGDTTEKSSSPAQLGSVARNRRLVFTVGTIAILDTFDRSNVNWDMRQTFLNMAFMTHASWDFAADARGFSPGAALEVYWDDWAARIARTTAPRQPNQLPLQFAPFRLYGDAFEIEHDHTAGGLAGSVHLHGFRTHSNLGRFRDAIAAFEADPGKNAAGCPDDVMSYGSQNAAAPDLCWSRGVNTKYGVGLSAEQYVSPGVGVFFRAMWADGEEEVTGLSPADRDVSLGAVAKGLAWRRPLDVAGVAVGLGWISPVHARYLAMGGVDNFVGDGHLSAGAEAVAEVFYSVNLLRAVWLSADYQRIWNPGFNTDRGPVNVLGGRVHVEY